MKAQILVVDDQKSFCAHIKAILEKEGYGVFATSNPKEAIEQISAYSFDILLTDIKMPEMTGVELFQIARQLDPTISGITMTAYGTISSAVQAIKQGISEYLQKPFEPEALQIAVEKTLRERGMLKEIHNLRSEVDKKYAFCNIIGKSQKMLQIFDLIQKVAPTDARVLITGETGVGKELVAKAIHYNSHRKNKPFVGINCGALAENLLEAELFGYEKGAFTGAVQQKAGKFEYADGGTLFLDEIGDISTPMQVKLLRVLQERVFERVGGNRSIQSDVRIISATNQDISEKIRDGNYRLELFYRLNVIPIHIPPLRERAEDIPQLVNHFIAAFNRRHPDRTIEISTSAMSRLMRYQWPGNVRELENVLERAIVITEGDTIDLVIFSGELASKQPPPSFHVNPDLPFKVSRDMIVQGFEKAYIYELVKRFDGNVSQAARHAGMTTRTLWRKLAEYKLDRQQFVR